MNPTTQSRSPYWDIVKGIGIIAIVLGHSCYFAVGFVYLFHLALFFFVSGYLYSEKKYGDALPFSATALPEHGPDTFFIPPASCCSTISL